MSNFIGKTKFGIKIFNHYKNWWMCFLEYFKLINKKKIIYRLRDKKKFLGRPHTFDFGIINEIIINKEYHHLLHHIKKESVVIDIGAQIGVFSVLAAKKAKKVKIFSYEPCEENYNLLVDNIKLNKAQGIIIPHNVAVGRKKEKRTLYINTRRSGNHTFFWNRYIKHIDDISFKEAKVNVIPLADVFKKNKIKQCDFLKIDCEGAEYEILFNTPPAILKKIKSISLEFHENGDISKLKQFLEKKGFTTTFGRKNQRMLFCERKQ